MYPLSSNNLVWKPYIYQDNQNVINDRVLYIGPDIEKNALSRAIHREFLTGELVFKELAHYDPDARYEDVSLISKMAHSFNIGGRNVLRRRFQNESDTILVSEIARKVDKYIERATTVIYGAMHLDFSDVPDVGLMYRSNHFDLQEVLSVCQKPKSNIRRFILISSAWVHASKHIDNPCVYVPENDKLPSYGQSPFPAVYKSVIDAEECLNKMENNNEICATIVRCTDLYGECDSTSLMFHIARWAAHSESADLPVPRNEFGVCQYTFANNVAHGIKYLIQAMRAYKMTLHNEKFFITDDTPKKSIPFLCDKIYASNESSKRSRVIPSAMEIMSHVSSSPQSFRNDSGIGIDESIDSTQNMSLIEKAELLLKCDSYPQSLRIRSRDSKLITEVYGLTVSWKPHNFSFTCALYNVLGYCNRFLASFIHDADSLGDIGPYSKHLHEALNIWMFFDPSKSVTLLQYKPKYNFEQSIDLSAPYYRWVFDHHLFMRALDCKLYNVIRPEKIDHNELNNNSMNESFN